LPFFCLEFGNLWVNVETFIKSVVREHHWAPSEFEDLYIDSVDYKGLVFWYNDIELVHKELNKKDKKNDVLNN